VLLDGGAAAAVPMGVVTGSEAKPLLRLLDFVADSLVDSLEQLLVNEAGC